MIDRQGYKQNLDAFSNYFLGKGWIHWLLLAGLVVLYMLLSKGGIPVVLGYGLIPLLICFVIVVLNHPKEGFYLLFGLQFVLIVGGLFMDIKLGVANLVLTLLFLILPVIYTLQEKVEWFKARNGMLLICLIWSGYCCLEIANPNQVQEAWNISITVYAVYPIACAILVPIAIRNIKGIQWLLLIWSVFILFATVKGYWQKSHGFNSKELIFLYQLGGAKTHIIWSGIRYFSCFTDAANYGVHMAMAITTFGISIFYTRNIGLKIYFALVVVAAIYGMGISGTRAAIAVPIGGLAFFVLLSRNFKTGIIGLTTLLALFFFFSFTNIGQSNQYIRKMRTAFQPSTDASYQVRVINRERMKELMAKKPIGYGLGLSKGERFYPKERMPYPPDSWLVSVWIETGIIGLVLYLLAHGALFAWCSWILMFKIRSGQLRGLLAAWLCMDAGFFVAAYVNDVMQYPNPLVIYAGFALCFAGPYIEKQMKQPTNPQLIEPKTT